MAENKVFIPQELKTLEIDTEKRIFRINGEDFGKGCTGFTIRCDAGKEDFFLINMSIDTTLHFLSYDRYGKLNSQKTYERKPKGD